MSLYAYYFFLGFAPAIFYVWYIYKKDRWEPEPTHQIVKIFFLGLISIVPAGLLEWIFQSRVFQIESASMTQYLSLNLAVCFLIIAPIEEFFKYSVVKTFVFSSDHFNEKVDGVVYMVASAMGFAALENVMYILNVGAVSNETRATWVGLMRGVLSTPAHAIFSGFVGVYLGQAKFAPTTSKSLGLTAWGLLIGIFLHGLYNALVFAGYPLFVIPLLLVSGYILMKKVNALVAESPFKPAQKQE
ncbi:MAG: PrsW family intramembrane metalloprotease [Candidatus Brocadiae bacterium]|nr:PrsW family intramembrane metalloprotease [Candidatus Brocadiia bacterium]